MARGSSKCPNCKAPIKGEPDYCEKCGLRVYFKCRKCGESWFRSDGSICPRCGGRPTD